MADTPRAGAEAGHAQAAGTPPREQGVAFAGATAFGRRAPAAPAAPDAVAALARRLAPTLQQLTRLHLRFERGRRLRSTHSQQVVLVSWEFAALRRGEAQAMVTLDDEAASALRGACIARGIRFVDNVRDFAP